MNIKNWLTKNKPNADRWFGVKNQNIYNKVLEETKFLDETYDGVTVPLSLRFACILSDVKEVPVCEHTECKNRVNFGKNQNRINELYNISFGRFCSTKCSKHGRVKYNSVGIEPDKDIFKEFLVNNIKTTIKTLLSSNDSNWVKENLVYHTNFLNEINPKPSYALMAFCIANDITSIPLCGNPKCSTPVGWNRSKGNPPYTARFNSYCSKSCVDQATVTKKRELTTFERYGATNSMRSTEILDKLKETNLNRYGTEWHITSDAVRRKIKTTVNDRYGVDSINHVKEIRERAKRTIKEKYGEECIFATNDFKQTQLEQNRKKYGVDYFNQKKIPESSFNILGCKDSLKRLIDEHGNYSHIADKLDVSPTTVKNYTVKHGIEFTPTIGISSGEIELREYIKSIVPERELVCNCRHKDIFGESLEIDIFIPSLNLGFEYNGIYWHSELYRTRNYHQNKTINAYRNDIKLVHIWEDDWNNSTKRDILKAKILHMVGASTEKIYARHTKIRYPSKDEVKEFLNKTHIQGHISYTHAFGLYHDNRMVACMTIKKTGKDGVFDLSRFSTSTHVVGGMSKLLHHFKENYIWNEIFTYASMDYSHGNVYEKVGFKRMYNTQPGLWYVEKGSTERINRHTLMKHKLKNMLPEFNESLTANENLEAHGFFRLYDCGSIRFSMKNE